MGDKGKVISFMNMKGGVCKTTLCINIANTLATIYNEKVLIIDMDPQFNATQCILGITENDYMKKYESFKSSKKTIYYLFDDTDREEEISKNSDGVEVGSLFNSNNFDEPYLKETYIVNVKNNLDMIVGDIDLIQLQITQKEGISKRLKRYIEYKKLKEQYKYILIDCAPTYSFYFTSAFTASDTYIIPLKPDYVSSLGLSLLQKAVKSIEIDNKPSSCGVVYTLIDPRNKMHEPIVEDIEKTIGKNNIFKESINYFVDIPKGIADKKFMLDISKNEIDKTIKSITEEFITRVGGKK